MPSKKMIKSSEENNDKTTLQNTTSCGSITNVGLPTSLDGPNLNEFFATQNKTKPSTKIFTLEHIFVIPLFLVDIKYSNDMDLAKDMLNAGYMTHPTYKHN